MLNSKNERELCYLVQVDNIEPIPGRDFTECAVVGGWRTLVKKGVFEPGSIGIYIEVDSKTPETPPFDFLEKYHYKIKTQKFKTFYSQGLLMHPSDFGWGVGWLASSSSEKDVQFVTDKDGNDHFVEDESRFLTKQLNVTYAVPEDNARKANSVDKYKKMAQRNGKLFSHQSFKWLMKKEWGRKLLFTFFGSKKDKTGWPAWVKKTDEERIENLPYLFEDKSPWIATEKIDGTSTTFTLKRGKGFKKDEFYICSRNACFDKPNKNCFYEKNVYIEMAEKYDIYNKMKRLLEAEYKDCEWITIQGETYGIGIQKRDYHMTEHNFMAFNLISSKNGRENSLTMKWILEEMNGIPCVPIVAEFYALPDTLEELREFVDSDTSVIDGEIREGIVFRSYDGSRSFKCVSPTYLMKYHQ